MLNAIICSEKTSDRVNGKTKGSNERVGSDKIGHCNIIV